MQMTAGHPPTKQELDDWYDIEKLIKLRQLAIAISDPPGLYHCVRIPWLPSRDDSLTDKELQNELNRELTEDWAEFFGPVPTFGHEVEDEDGAYKQSCYYGNRAKLQDYVALVTSVFPLLPCHFLHRVDYQRDARIDCNLWTLGIYRRASSLPYQIALDGRGEGAYRDWRMDAGLALEYFRDPSSDSGGRMGIERHLDRFAYHGMAERTAEPAFIYLALQSDLCSATAALIDQFIREFDAGGHRPRSTSLIFGPPKSDGSQGSSDPKQLDCPPDGNWHFPPGEFSFVGVTGKLCGKHRELLEILAQDGRKHYAKDLVDEFEIQLSSLRSNISTLNKCLRETFGLAKNSRPITSTGRGEKHLLYEIDTDLLRSGRLVPERWRNKTKSAQNQR